MATPIGVSQLIERLRLPLPPHLFDVRRAHVFGAAPTMISGAEWRDPSAVDVWSGSLDPRRPVVVYCAHGHAVSRGVADALSAIGFSACYVDGGIAAWIAAGGALTRRRPSGVTWITRDRPKIDRIACPWLIVRFIDPAPRFVFAPAEKVFDEAERLQAIPFDIPGADLSHRGDLCSFDSFLADYGIDEPAVRHLAVIVRAADTGRLDLAPQAAGLLAISLGLSANHADDHEMLGHGLVVYDALYTWCRSCTGETHGWPPAVTAAIAG